MKSPESEIKNTPDIKRNEESDENASYRLSSGVGIMMIIASFILMIANFPFAFDVASLAWGSILIGLGQYFRYRERVTLLETQEKQLELEYLKEQHSYKLTIAEKILPQLSESGESLNVIKDILKDDFVKLSLPDNQEPHLRIKNELKNRA